MRTSIPICAQWDFKPARFRVIRGKAELLSRMGIIGKLDIAVRFANSQFKVGQSVCGMMTFNENHRWVFTLVPTDCAYAKLNGYFGNFQNSAIKYYKRKGISVEIYLYESFTGETTITK